MTEKEQQMGNEIRRLQSRLKDLLWSAEYFETEYNRLFEAVNEHDCDWLSGYLLSIDNIQTADALGMDADAVAMAECEL